MILEEVVAGNERKSKYLYEKMQTKNNKNRTTESMSPW